MTLNVLYAGRASRWPEFEPVLARAFAQAGMDVNLGRDIPPDQVDYIIFAPTGPVRDFTPFTRARAVLSLWAGVEKVVDNPTLHIPLTRMVDEGLTQGMQDWVTGQVLRHHLGLDRHILDQSGQWDAPVPPLAPDRPVTVLGLGALGQTCARALAGLGFAVTGWSRRPKSLPGINCQSGPDGLRTALASAQILVLLLPATPDTDSILDARALAALPRGAVVINPGRGTLIDDDALLVALDAGHVSHATLDVFRIEPLPHEHPFWAHPRVTVTPHIAADTRPDTSARVIAANILRSEAGEALLHEVDRHAGY